MAKAELVFSVMSFPLKGQGVSHVVPCVFFFFIKFYCKNWDTSIVINDFTTNLWDANSLQIDKMVTC